MTSITPGHLPVGPFAHTAPTALLDLDLTPPFELRLPTPPPAEATDCLILIRLHADPIAVLHLTTLPQTAAEAAERCWPSVAEAVREHVRQCGCGKPPVSFSEATQIGPAIDSERPSPPNPRDVAVIVPTTRGGETLARCLRSLAQSSLPPTRIVVVDNAPHTGRTEPVVAELSASMANLTYIAEERPGSSTARNRGVAEVSSPLVAFTDDDVVVDEAWLAWLVSPFVDPRVSAVAGCVLPLTLQTEAEKLFELYAGFSKGFQTARYDTRDRTARRRFLYPYWGGVFGSGNSMAFRRADLVHIGGFDPALGAGSPALAGADIDALSQIVLGGGSLAYEPRSLCWHEHRVSRQALERQVFNYGAGFTAILTKAALSQPAGLTRAAVRSLPVLWDRLGRLGRADVAATSPRLPRDLTRLQRRGLLRGPLLYARSRAWARRRKLHEVLPRSS